MVLNYKRLLSGLFLITILILSFYFKLDYFFLIFMSILIGLELIKNNLTDKKLLFINFLLFIFIFFVLTYFDYLKIYFSSILLNRSLNKGDIKTFWLFLSLSSTIVIYIGKDNNANLKIII